MRVRVVETGHYLRKAGRLLSKREQDDLAAHLAENPMVHDVIPGLGGLRKVRWSQAARRKGKRGGVRVIYFFALSAEVVFLLDIYSKGKRRICPMLTKKNSGRRSKKLSAASSKPRSRLAQNLMKSMGEVQEFLDGKRALHVRHYDVPERINVRAIREKVGMSQAQFALRFAISPRTLQEWEQGRRLPDATVRAYLVVIDRNPRAVEEALAGH